MAKLIGNAPNQVPTNGDLGSMAFEDRNNYITKGASVHQPYRNLIINGDMSIAQRGTSSTSSAYATVDRFYTSRDATSATQSQETLSSSDSPYSLGFRNYYRLTNTSTTSATSSYIGFNHKIEAQNLAKSGWEYTSSSSAVTLSFWVRSSLAGTYYGNARTDDGSPDYNYAFPITLSANTWTKITKTIYGNSNLTIDNDNGFGLHLIFWLHLGTNYTTSSHTIGQWNVYSATDQAPDFSQNWRNTASATFDITGVQLEVGTSASDFEFLPYDVNLQRCQRYYQEPPNQTIYATTTSTYIGEETRFPTTMRATPTLTQTFTNGGSASRTDQNLIARGTLGLRTYIKFSSAGSQTGRVDVSGITADAEL